MKGQGFTRPPIWQLTKREGVIVASEREYKGARFFELRFWADGGAKPTKQGVTFSPYAVADLAKALAAYAAELDA